MACVVGRLDRSVVSRALCYALIFVRSLGNHGDVHLVVVVDQLRDVGRLRVVLRQA